MINFDETSYHTKSAVLFLIFNRPDTTDKVFEQIRSARPPRLYIAADAYRPHVENEELLCEQAKETVNHIDWECEVKTLYSDENLGCRNAVSSAINWFFDHEEEGIILEDDCLPANSFFKFCDVLLEEYRYDTRIRHISGCNLQQGKEWGDGSYYFSNRTHVWGWAAWRRVWQDFEVTLHKYDNEQIKNKIKDIYVDPLVCETWVSIFKDLKAGKIDSWAHQLDFANLFNNGLAIIPNVNLISNIGFGNNATHTFNDDNVYANVPLKEIDEIIAPTFFLPEKQADMRLLIPEFNIEQRRRKQLRKKVKSMATYFFSVFSF